MPAKDLGTKHACFKCGTKFYDLKRAEPICPKCGADQRQSPALKPASAGEKRARASSRPAAPPPVPEVVEPDGELEEDAEAEEADEADEAEEDDEP